MAENPCLPDFSDFAKKSDIEELKQMVSFLSQNMTQCCNELKNKPSPQPTDLSPILQELQSIKLLMDDYYFGIISAIQDLKNDTQEIKVLGVSTLEKQSLLERIFEGLSNLFNPNNPTVDLSGIENKIDNCCNQLIGLHSQTHSELNSINFNVERYGLTNSNLNNQIIALINQILSNPDNDPLIEKIYKILGGDLWEGSSNIYARINPDSEIKAKALEHLGQVEAEYENPQDLIANNIFDLFACYLSSPYWKQGLHEYPQQVVSRLTNNDESDNNQSDIKIYNKDEFFRWFVSNYDEQIGEFPINIEVHDSDFLQTGNQKLEVQLPNIAETLAELTTKAIGQDALNSALLAFVSRTLIELGSTKKAVLESYYKIESLQDYAGMKLSQKKKKVQFTFNPEYVPDDNNPDSISKFLDASKASIRIEEYDEKTTLENQLLILRRAASVIMATSTESMPESAIDWVKKINDEFDFLKGLTKKDLDDSSEPDKDDFQEFLDHVEDGFTDYGNIHDKINPYGKDKKYRPKIKRINKPSNNT